MTDIADIIARWKSGEGRPYKGRLIDMEAYNQAPDNIGCMCAQGQVLHLLGGWTAERLANMGPAESDRETANLLGIGRAHAALLRIVNDSREGCPSAVIENPAAVLGDQWRAVLAFWRHLDRMAPEQWAAAGAAARAAAGAAAGAAARAAARAAAWAAARAAAWATNEIQGAAVMRERGQSFFFLPLFGFADPAAVLAAEEAGQ